MTVTPPRPARAWARPRVGLAGNPSDLYGGAVLSFTFEEFVAEVTVEPTERPVPPRGAGAELLSATLKRFATRFPELGLGRGEGLRAELAFTSDIPREAGLAGSSAIVLAALRALAQAHGVGLEPDDQARLALAAEVEELGSIAGPQDRLVQAHGGFLFMDFAAEPWRHERFDPSLLPPALVVWKHGGGRDSGSIHRGVRERWLAGEAAVRAAMEEFRRLAERAAEALRRRDADALRAVVDANLDLRASLFPLAENDLEAVALGRAAGAAVKLCGSGGALLALTPDGDGLAPLEEAYRGAGFQVVRPTVSRILPA